MRNVDQSQIARSEVSERVAGGPRHPRLLFLSYAFPPLAAVGSVRCWNIAKYLSRRGWDVTVVTPDPALFRHAEEAGDGQDELDKLGMRRVVTGHPWRCLNPSYLRGWNGSVGWFFGGVCRRIARAFDCEAEIGWNAAVRDACAGLNASDFDLVLASGNPFSVFGLTREIARCWNLPYVLDYRDLWTTNPHSKHRYGRRLRNLERLLLEDAAAVTTVSPSLAEVLGSQYQGRHRPQVVMNGYDPEELRSVEPYPFGHFAIVYTGTFYPPMATIEPFFEALKRLDCQVPASSGSAAWRFHYCGRDSDYVHSAALAAGLPERVVIHGQVDRSTALRLTRGAAVSLVITSVEHKATTAVRGIVTGKIFETVGLGTDLLLIAPPGSDAETLLRSGGGRRFSGRDAEGIARHLESRVRGGSSRSSPPAEYAWPQLIARLDDVLKAAIGERQGGHTPRPKVQPGAC